MADENLCLVCGGDADYCGHRQPGVTVHELPEFEWPEKHRDCDCSSCLPGSY